MRRFTGLCYGAVLAMAVGVLGFSPDRVGAVPPPYDADDNKLIDQKLGKITQGDPQWLVDGKFYNVGRNPDPLPGNPQTDWGDYRFRVTHIKFDYSKDIGMVDEPGEGLELQYDRGSGRGFELDHIQDQRGKGEWIYRWADDPDKGRHEPALYACKEAVKIKVRIECADPIASAEVGAKQVPLARGQVLAWRDVNRTRVEFMQKIPGQVKGIGGKVYDASTGNGTVARIESDRLAYKAAACDVGHSGTPGTDWRDDEKVARKRDGRYQPTPPEPWLDQGYQDTIYTTSNDAEGFAAEHANMVRVKRKSLNLE